ncbi:hypothetical protein EXIGLDRAFT_729526, partial [Exidia glandulosa HHB12029]
CACVCEWALVAAPKILLKARNGAYRLRRESGTVAVARLLERGRHGDRRRMCWNVPQTQQP